MKFVRHLSLILNQICNNFFIIFIDYRMKKININFIILTKLRISFANCWNRLVRKWLPIELIWSHLAKLIHRWKEYPYNFLNDLIPLQSLRNAKNQIFHLKIQIQNQKKNLFQQMNQYSTRLTFYGVISNTKLTCSTQGTDPFEYTIFMN